MYKIIDTCIFQCFNTIFWVSCHNHFDGWILFLYSHDYRWCNVSIFLIRTANDYNLSFGIQYRFNPFINCL